MMENIPKQVKLGAIGLMLLAAIAVDFVSSMMSILADMAFIGAAVWVAWPLLMGGGKKDGGK